MHQKLSLPGEGLWPQITSNHGEHPYARDRSVVTWSQSDQTSGDVIRIVTTNESAYSGYVDKGYTRYGGKGSAKPWKARGSRSYVGMVRGKLHVRAAGALFVRGLLRG